jgi:hypothetical protein
MRPDSPDTPSDSSEPETWGRRPNRVVAAPLRKVASPVSPAIASPVPAPLPPEDPLVLDEIDRIISELQNRRGNGSPGERSRPWYVPDSGDGEEFVPAPSGYFEEHLDAARRAVGTIHEKVGELESASTFLRQRVAAAESELDRISREYQFVRGRGRRNGSAASAGPVVPLWSEEEPSATPTLGVPPTPSLSSGSFTAIRAASASPPPPAYERFTVDRYNRTIDSLRASRSTLVVLTLVLSAVVGVALLALVLYSPIVNPPIWVAALPLVWIVPIPYFLLSFRGTHRVLGESHLNLPEAK